MGPCEVPPAKWSNRGTRYVLNLVEEKERSRRGNISYIRLIDLRGHYLEL